MTFNQVLRLEQSTSETPASPVTDEGLALRGSAYNAPHVNGFLSEEGCHTQQVWLLTVRLPGDLVQGSC